MLIRKVIPVAISMVGGCATTDSALNVSYPTPTAREKSISVPDYDYLDLFGKVASKISNFRVEIIEEDRGNDKVRTHFVVDFSIYNNNWDREGTTNAFITLDIRDAGGNIIAPQAFTLSVDRYSCTYGGARHQHEEGIISSPIFQNAKSATVSKQGIVIRRENPC